MQRPSGHPLARPAARPAGGGDSLLQDKRTETMVTKQTTPPFPREALELLFEKSNFKSFQKAGCMSHYWAPLLSACSGTRRNEIFYLTPDDVLLQHGIWVIRIAPHGSRNQTPGPMARDIPMHPLLHQLGFIEFVQARRHTHPNERLFSEYRAIQEHAGMVFSRAFVHWIKTTVEQLPDEKKSLFAEDFHFPSLRALFSVEAIRSGMSEVTFRKVHGLSDGFQTIFDEKHSRDDLENAAIEVQRMDMASYFPALYPYDALVA